MPGLVTLRAVCLCLVPQPERPIPVDLAGVLDERIARGKGNGWHYDALPPAGEALKSGLRDVDQRAQAKFARGASASRGDQRPVAQEWQ